jgi:nucleotide-binding universal stress UspA family protein
MSDQFQGTDASDRRAVVVGVGTSPSARAALAVAAQLAEQHAWPLHLVRVWRDVDWFLSAPAGQLPLLSAEEKDDERLLVDEYVRARELAADVPVTCEFVPGSVYAILLERSQGARLLVLGCSGTRPGPGEIGSWYLEHARCPVRIVAADGSTAATTEPSLTAAPGARH